MMQARQPSPPSAATMLKAYRLGMFLMAEDSDGEDLFWCEPPLRGIFPLEQFHFPRRALRSLKASSFTIKINHAFAQTVSLCRANNKKGRDTSWINPTLLRLYQDLHHAGAAHSVECWDGERLVGGVFGVASGAAFFGESMFHLSDNASKFALLAVRQRLVAGGFSLFDAQFRNPHLMQFGLQEIPREEYQELLAAAISKDADFFALPRVMPVAALTQAAKI